MPVPAQVAAEVLQTSALAVQVVLQPRRTGIQVKSELRLRQDVMVQAEEAAPVEQKLDHDQAVPEAQVSRALFEYDFQPKGKTMKQSHFQSTLIMIVLALALLIATIRAYEEQHAEKEASAEAEATK